MTEERKEELLREWDLTDNMDDAEYWEWYDGLPSEEQAQIDAWEKQYSDGFARMCKEILDMESQRQAKQM